MKTRKSLHRTEVIITVLQALIITFFIFLQFMPSERSCFPCIDRDTAGIFLQVDATVLTLTIALVALIGGFLPDSHMGISYSDYFLNLRPQIYRQDVIIIISLLYFGLGCVFFWFQWNYLAAGILFCEILLIVMSVLSIYGIFRGKDDIKKEIEGYSERMQINGKG